MHRTRAGALAVAALLATGACTGGGSSGSSPSASPTSAGSTASSPSDPASGSPSATSAQTLARPHVAGVIATDLEVPWGLAFLPDGSALVSERSRGRVVHVESGGQVRDVGAVGGVTPNGEGGLLGLAVSPRFATDHLLFAYLTAGSENRVVRMRYEGGRLHDQRTILDGIPAGFIHDGGRIAFGPDGFLYVGTGEAGRRDPAQDIGDLGGKILRITTNGDPAPGNPFDGSPVYSYGHRNVQGLAWDSAGRLWASEFGQDTWDELNLIRPGGNYGWPRVEGRANSKDYFDPARQWHTDVASPSGVAVADGAVYMAALRGERLWQIPLHGARAGQPRAFFVRRYGRLRTVALAPDGSLWLTTSNRDGRGSPQPGDDKIIRLTLS